MIRNFCKQKILSPAGRSVVNGFGYDARSPWSHRAITVNQPNQQKGIYTMSKRVTLSAIAALTFVLSAGVLSSLRSEVAAEGFPSAKAAVAIDELVNLSSAVADPQSPSGDTGWVNILNTQIKTSSQKDLVFDVAMQCGIVTDTTVKSSGGNQSTATARANIAVRVLVDGVAAEPNNSIDANQANASGVVYCDRIQTLAAKFAGLNCTADLTTGAVTCEDPEELQLILKTLNANAFNFAKADVGVGVHSIVVQARAQANVSFDNSGALAGAEAFAGAGSLLVEEVRLVRGAEIIIE